MQMVCNQVKSYMESASWIRRMFEAGLELKKEHGAENVFDFSLGNPDLPPGKAVGAALHAIAERAGEPLALGYMPNAGYLECRNRVAELLSVEQQTELWADRVVMTCGAAGGLNAFFRAVLEPGDEVVCPAPYFVEYGFYAGNFGGRLRPVSSDPATFAPDLAAIDAAINHRTRVLLVNSPNNPTGVVYTRAQLEELAAILIRHTERNGRPIYLVSDEPYRFLVYDGVEVPPVFPLYPYSVVVGSFSKSLSLAGERVGYLAVNPAMGGARELTAAVVLTNRILGFVNAPAVGQLVVARALGAGVDVSVYRDRRDAMARVLTEAGIDYVMPGGAFYFFPRVPGGSDDVAFCERLRRNLILGVPGRGFGAPGFFRLTFCMDRAIIERSAPAFKRAVFGNG